MITIAITHKRNTFNIYDDDYLTHCSNAVYAIFYQLLNQFQTKELYAKVGINNLPNHVLVIKLTDLVYHDIDIDAYKIKTNVLFILKSFIYKNNIEGVVSSQTGSSNIVMLLYINERLPKEKQHRKLIKIIESLIYTMKVQKKHNIAIGANSLIGKRIKYYTAYRQALIALDLAYLNEESGYLLYDSLPKETIPHKTDIDNYITRLISNISTANKDAIDKTLIELFNEVIINNVNRATLKSYLLKIINHIELHIIKSGADKDAVNSLESSNKIIDCFNINTMKDIMHDFLASAITEIKLLSSPAYKRLKLVIDDYIERNYQHVINVDDLAILCLYSRFHFMRVFKKIYGVTFSEYLTEFRYQKAKYLLTETQYSIKEVAEKTGYSNTSYFRSVFKNRSGKTPQEFKQLNENGIPEKILPSDN